MDLNVNIEALLKDQAKKVVSEPYDNLIKTMRTLAPKIKGVIWEGPFTPSLDDMPPEYYDLQARLGEYLKVASMKVEYKSWTIEMRSVIPAIPDKVYLVKYVVNFDATKPFTISMVRNNLFQPGAAQFLMSAFQDMVPGMTKDLKGAFEDLRKDLLLPTIRTGSLEVDKGYIVRGDNGLLLQDSFSNWQVREYFASEESPVKSLTIRGARDLKEIDEAKGKFNSLSVYALVNPTDESWIIRGFDMLKAEIDVLCKLKLITKPVTLTEE